MSEQDKKEIRFSDAVRRRRNKKIFWGVVVLIAAAGLADGVVQYAKDYNKNLPGQSYPVQGQEHVALDYAFSYNSNPPTSGPHFSQPANWGVYDYEVHDKLFIHNLEHGGVWISYRPNIPASVIGDLKSIVNELGGSKLVMASRSANDNDIAVAAWTRLLKFNLVGGRLSEDQKNQIRAFYRAFKNRGPEFVPDSMPGVDPKSFR
ncbi:MAG: DUF3105 domain-containing protein [Candidatus Sungbacteria bacterium]|uniref:DUF3105 domain-containing protein n=1 Tax=Candidatus Sungiibacteriota bacterium TaxID=2750080 RepID=A0A932QYC2_9BACT|nr:DUF3105 domain-containing protein [Candidatus Sungbacteria bacterium]